MEPRDSAVTEKVQKKQKVLIEEIILENFMSYTYAKIPFKSGLNIICGPNGAGKSSILLAISVALGQAYTERSRKLSDLIQRGRDIGRVSLLFDNSLKDGKRPIPSCRSDRFLLSRYLRRDGSYWYEADFHVIEKHGVTRLFRQLGINPDNLLIIMHQGMVEEFSITSSQEKLKMVEEAVGFQEYRKKLLEAQEKLTGLLSEESSLNQLMEHAGETLGYWKDLHDKYLLKQTLLQRKQLLECEIVWSDLIRNERILNGFSEKLEAKKRVLAHTVERVEKAKVATIEISQNLKGKQIELRKLYFTYSRLERDFSGPTIRIEMIRDFLIKIDNIIELLNSLLSVSKSVDVKGIEERIRGLRYVYEKYNVSIEESERRYKDLAIEVKAIQNEIGVKDEELSKLIEKYVEFKITEALLVYEQKNLEREVSAIEHSVTETKKVLGTLLSQAEATCTRIETLRVHTEISDDIKIVQGQLQSLTDVPDEADKIYLSYASNYEEIKQQLEEVIENKKKVLVELDERKKIWFNTLQALIDGVNPMYQNVLHQIGASGIIRLANSEEVDEAGLELLVGFRGSLPVVLDAYTQSGGERSVSIMAFLLSLQDRIVSPFRAIDEFDVHMDPRNREQIFKMLFSFVKKKSDTQYLIITPSQLTILEEDVNLIFVQNIGGKSEAGRGQIE